ncbi:hypothetical protein HHO41_04870 [Bacillus sp. DNRA2]|nr:hypothetical protein [Bacillus sp. DNRA2]NMD69613.1 hypothetical protein [Bacillus sp. DNRA2]
MSEKKTTRVEIRLNDIMLKKVDDYKEDNSLPSRAAAILELMRKGLGK